MIGLEESWQIIRGSRWTYIYQSIVCHMCATIFDTGTERLSQNAKDSHPYKDMKSRRGSSKIRTMAMERTAGRVTTVRG